MGKFCWRRYRLPIPIFLGFPCGSPGKESTCNAGDLSLIPGLRRSPEKEKATHFSIVSMVSNDKLVGLKSFKTVAKEFKNIGK